jgi:hypothetical protein
MSKRRLLLNENQLDVTGSSGVQSVTGSGVNNTDPLNPVISYPTPANIGAEPAFSKANLISGPNIAISGVTTNRLVGSGDVVISHSFDSSETITDSNIGTNITVAQNTEYAYTFSSFDRSAPVGTCFIFEFSASIIYQNATDINNFRVIIDIVSSLDAILPLIPTAVSFPNNYIFKVVVTRLSDRWIQVLEIIGGSIVLDSRIAGGNSFITTSTNFNGSVVAPKIALKTPNLSFTTGDRITYNYIHKFKVK